MIYFILLVSCVMCKLQPPFPDVISCADDHVALMYIRAIDGPVIWYCQIWDSENRCIIFYTNGTYKDSIGDYRTRKGCMFKSLSQLEIEGETFDI